MLNLFLCLIKLSVINVCGIKGYLSPLIINLRPRGTRAVNFTPRSFYLQERIPVSIEWEYV